MWNWPLQQLPDVSGVPPLVLLDSGVVSDAAALEVTDLPAGFQVFIFNFDNLLPASDNVNLRMRVREQGQPAFEAGATNYRGVGWHALSSSAALNAYAVQGDPQWRIWCDQGQGNLSPNEEASGTITLHNPRSTIRSRVQVDGIVPNDVSAIRLVNFGGFTLPTVDHDAFQLFYNAGNILTMNWTLYGLRS